MKTGRKLAIVSALVASLFTVTLTVAQPALAHKPVIPSNLPPNIAVLPPNRPFLGHAIGTQNYVCSPSGNEFKLKSVHAAGDAVRQCRETDHDSLLQPDLRMIRSARSAPRGNTRETRARSGAKWSRATTPRSIRAIDRLRAHGHHDRRRTARRPRANDIYSAGEHHGRPAPATACSSAADVGKFVFVPYTADYIFYTDRP